VVSTSLFLSPLITFVIKSILLALLLSCLSTYAADEPVKTAQVAAPSTIVWPTQMATKIYVLPVKIDPAAIADAKKKNAEGISILPPDEEETKKKLTDLKTDLTAAILEKMKDAELPAQIWTSSSPVPADGWKLEGNVVNLDPGKKVIGTDNPVVGIVISIADSNHPITEPFLVYNSSAKAKMSPGPGISPFAKIGNMIAKGTGLQESMQIGRLAESVTEHLGEAMEKHGLKKKDD
jgi:hypothetical protein